jgi:hypothetical protein
VLHLTNTNIWQGNVINCLGVDVMLAKVHTPPSAGVSASACVNASVDLRPPPPLEVTVSDGVTVPGRLPRGVRFGCRRTAP